MVPFLGYCKKNKIKVTVIGKFNVENRVYGERIQYLGKYRNTDLGNILQQSGVNVVFFTSVWPETFSYLISELMALNIPICCFDIGAQGEKIGGYEYGHLIHYGDAENMFRQIAAFWKSSKHTNLSSKRDHALEFLPINGTENQIRYLSPISCTRFTCAAMSGNFFSATSQSPQNA